MGELGVVIGKHVFKPRPVRLRRPVEQLHQPRGERFADLLGEAIAAQALQILMNAEQGESPRARRGEVGHRRQRLGEELSGHDLETAIRRAAHAHAQRPQRPAVRILRALFIEPAAVEAQVVVEAPGLGIERVMQERRVSGGQRPHALRLFLHLVQQHGENEGARVVVRAVAFGEIRHGEQGVLEEAGRVGHPRQMVQLQLRQLARLLIQGLGGKRLSRQHRPLAAAPTRTSACRGAPRCSRPSRGPACRRSCEWRFGAFRRAAVR